MNWTTPNQKCSCLEKFYLNADSTACTSSCPIGQALDLQGLKCITKSAGCGPDTLAIDWTATNQACHCAAGAFLNVASDACIRSVPAGAALNLQGTKCISQASGCGPNTYPIDWTKPGQQCSCLFNFILSIDGNECIALSSCKLMNL